MTRKATLFALFVLVAVAANVASARFGLVPIGFGLVVSAGTFAAGLALVGAALVWLGWRLPEVTQPVLRRVRRLARR